MSAGAMMLAHRYGAKVRAALRRQGRRFLYPGAEIGVQPEVAAAIERFRQLPEAKRALWPSLWGWLLGELGTPPKKIPKDDVQWAQEPVRGQKCGNCMRWYKHPVTGTTLCDSVRGVWPAESWCERWVVPWSAARYRAYQTGGSLEDQVAEEMFGENWLASAISFPSVIAMRNSAPKMVPGTPPAPPAPELKPERPPSRPVQQIINQVRPLVSHLQVDPLDQRVLHLMAPANRWTQVIALASRVAQNNGMVLEVIFSGEDLLDPANTLVNMRLGFLDYQL